MLIEVNVHEKSWYNATDRPRALIKKIVKFCLKELGIAKYNPKISVVLANDVLLLQLNHSYRKINRTTNVLSFNYEDLSRCCYLGEIYLSLEQITRESEEMCVNTLTHFSHMLVHGVLHILGYNHEELEETKVMQALEVRLLKKMGIANPYVSRET